MFARSSTLGLVAAVAFTLPSNPSTTLTLHSSGAVRLAVTGTDARYGLSPELEDGKPIMAVTLGATGSGSALWLYTQGDELPRVGRYPIAFSWDHAAGTAEPRWFHACFIAGTTERPAGVFHGQSGWVTITDAAPGHLAGEFELRARGFLVSNEADEDQWVTVRGSFTADGDTAIAWFHTVSR
ncbi:MAG TPA: hypothetical protein VFN40_03215 [Gemmatimonadales bacterium]|nr:hypothetical protein [Gemmatimonadales bacterium]